MFMTGIERKSYEEGEANGRFDERKENFDNAVQSLMEMGSSKEEATKQALQILRLKNIPV